METGHVDAHVRLVARQSELNALRRSGWVPGIVYGGDQPPANISVPERMLEDNIRGSKKFIDLTVNGQSVLATIRQTQVDPVTKHLVHVDFYRVTADRVTVVEIPVQLHGVSVAQRQGSIIQQQIRAITVEALPKDTPEYISVDVSSLEPGQHLTVGDVVLPPGVVLKSNTTEVLATALAQAQVVVPEEVQASQESQETT